MFNGISSDYDVLNRILSFGVDIRWRSVLIRALLKEKPQKILDIATGTGSLALEIAQRSTSKITGVDVSEKMLEMGIKKVKKANLEKNVSLVLGDAENLSFSDAQFDAVTSAFGVRNFENLQIGLQEMYRVLKPEGSVFILEFSLPRYFPLKQWYSVYYRFIFPLLSRFISKDSKMHHYLFESLQNFPSGEQFLKALEQVGFQQGSKKSLSFGVVTLYRAYKKNI